MNLTVEFSGTDQPFEGERTLWVKGLPPGVQVDNATVTVRPVPAPGQPLFVEILTFANGQEPFGATKVPGTNAVEVAFHARRTLAAVRGAHLNSADLLVDLGAGVFMSINQSGALAAPGDAPYRVIDHTLPGLTVAGLRLNAHTPIGDRLDVSQITIRSLPAQVSLALGEQPPFWTQTGELTGPETSRNFAEFLQVYLDEEAELVDGYFQVPLVIHSDTIARLDATVAIEYQQVQSGLPADVGEVTLKYAVDSTPQVDSELIQLALPAGAEVTSASVQVQGAFDDSRILVGPTGQLTPSAPVPITAGRSQAQPILLETAAPTTAIDLLLSSVSETAVVDLNLRSDADGRPFDEPLLPAPVEIDLTRELAANPTWLSARLPDEFQFLAGQRYWLELQVRDGEAIWHADPAQPGKLGMLQTTNNGLSWRQTKLGGGDGPLAGYYRLRNVPDQYSVPLELSVGRGVAAERVSLQRYAPLQRIDFTIDFPEFVQALNQAARREESARCPLGEQLSNPDFERWKPVDRQIGQPEPVSQLGEVTITIAPNGLWAMAGSLEGETNFSRFVSLPDHVFLGNLDYAPASPDNVAIDAGTRRIYVVDTFNTLRVIDAETFATLGDGLRMGPSVSSLALAPDGGRLYLASQEYEGQGSVMVIDTNLLEGALSSGGGASIADVLAAVPSGASNPFELRGR